MSERVFFSDIAHALRETLASQGGAWVDLPVLVDAGLLLDLSGELVRGRLVMAAGLAPEQALRPDLTVPAALDFAACPSAARRYLLDGVAFRAPGPGDHRPPEFRQIGFEWFGDLQRLESDIAAVRLTLDALAAAGAPAKIVRFGDPSLYQAALAATPLSPSWRRRFASAFGRPQRLERLFLEAQQAFSPPHPALSAALKSAPADASEQAIAELFAIAGFDLVGARDITDIAERLIDQGDRASEGPLPLDALAALKRLLAVEGRADEALTALERLDQEFGLAIAQRLMEWRARLAVLSVAHPGCDFTFAPAFGGGFAYYDGLIFQASDPALPEGQAMAAGGRYDGLIAKVSGGKAQAPAIGAMIRPDRVRFVAGARR